MRHRVGTKKLNRTTGHRKALLRNLSSSLIINESIETTIVKAKFVKPYVEKIITKAKKSQNIGNLNRVKARLNSEEATRRVFEELVSRYRDTPGGYTRIVKLGFRAGDKAPMARLEFVKKPEGKKTKAESTENRVEVTSEEVGTVLKDEKTVSTDSKKAINKKGGKKLEITTNKPVAKKPVKKNKTKEK